MQPTQYDFRYEDSDTLMNELQEFFSYYEAESFQDELGAFEVSFKGGTSSSIVRPALRSCLDPKETSGGRSVPSLFCPRHD